MIRIPNLDPLYRVSLARSMDKTKPALNGMILEPGKPGFVVAAATDGFKLAWAVLELERTDQELKERVLIPGGLCDRIPSVRNFRGRIDFTKYLEVDTTARELRIFTGPKTPRLEMPFGEGNFPAWRKVVPAAEGLGCDRSVVLDPDFMTLGKRILCGQRFYDHMATTPGNSIAVASYEGVCFAIMPIKYAEGLSPRVVDVEDQLRRVQEVLV